MRRMLIMAAVLLLVSGLTGVAWAYPLDLQRLDERKLVSVREALLAFQQNVAGMDAAGRDRAFLEFREFYYRFIGEYSESGFAGDARRAGLTYESDTIPAAAAALVRALRDSGLDCYRSEGDLYVGEHPDFLHAHFHYYLSPDLQRYLELRQQELAEGFAADAGLVISFAQVGERVARWEEFLARYPESGLAGEARYHYNNYLAVFLTGMDNSPVFDYPAPHRLRDENRSAYNEYRRAYPATPSGRLVDRFYELLRRQGFRRTAAVERFYRENRVDALLDPVGPAQ